MFKLAIGHNEKIVITALDNIVTAKRYVGKTAVAVGVARCSPDDRFNFDTGAKLAFERMLKDYENKPEYYNGRVVCLRNNCNIGIHTVGKIYEFIDGRYKADDGRFLPSIEYRIKSFDDLCKKSNSHWLEIKE